MKIRALMNEVSSETGLPPSREDLRRSEPSAAQSTALREPACVPGSWARSLQNLEEQTSVADKPPSLQHFVITA